MFERPVIIGFDILGQRIAFTSIAKMVKINIAIYFILPHLKIKIRTPTLACYLIDNRLQQPFHSIRYNLPYI
jgi:hypothetical protein